MTLHQYLIDKDVSIAAFGRDLGVSNTSVWKWVNNISLPSGAHMIAIHKMTDGAVTSADWGLEDGQKSACQWLSRLEREAQEAIGPRAG